MLKPLSQKIVGIDINPDNVQFLKDRFQNDFNLSFYVTNGVQVPPEVEEGVTFVYCFDAMVHFDKEIVGMYLQEAYRLMVPGAMGFIHHSQTPRCPVTTENGFCSNPDIIGNDPNNPHQRNVHSKEEFILQANGAGLNVLTQVDVSWGDYKAIDAISIIQKPLA